MNMITHAQVNTVIGKGTLSERKFRSPYCALEEESNKNYLLS